jgi:hypothetical protein
MEWAGAHEGEHVNSARMTTVGFVAVASAGCAAIDFDSETGMTYFEPVPYLYVTNTPDCTQTATVVVVPGPQKHMKLNNGFGSNELSASLTNGMIASVGQKTDSKIPETLTALVGTGGALTATTAAEGGAECHVGSRLYPIKDGKLTRDEPFDMDPPKPKT